MPDDFEEVNLTPHQRAHLAKVFFETRTQLAQYMLSAAPVFIDQQNEVSEAGKYAVAIAAAPDFWVDCAETHQAAENLARELGFVVVENPHGR